MKKRDTSNDPQLAGLALQFLDRVNMTGAEVEAYLAVRQWIRQLATPAEVENEDKAEKKA